MVFQSYALYPAYERLRQHGLRSASCARRPRPISTSACRKPPTSSASVTCFDRKPKQLSGGQRQRVALGRAIVREPQVFLMDEPLSNLDAKLRVQTRAELIKLHQRLGTTFIYVTHDQVEAMTMGTRIAVMRDGVLQQIDTPQNLYDHPAQHVRRRLHRQPSHELLRCDARQARQQIDGGWRLVPPRSAGVAKAQVVAYAGKPVKFGIRPEAFTPPVSSRPASTPPTPTPR